jgi:hypothetical protein
MAPSGKVGLDTGSIHQRRADDDDFHAGFISDLTQTLLGLVLTLAVGVLRVGRIGFCERLPGMRGFAIDLD